MPQVMGSQGATVCVVIPGALLSLGCWSRASFSQAPRSVGAGAGSVSDHVIEQGCCSRN